MASSFRLSFRFIFIFMLCIPSQYAQNTCMTQLIDRWNHFVDDANGYMKMSQEGILDMKRRVKVEHDWVEVTHCECW